MIDKSKFKNSQGIYLLRGLFYEETGSDKSTVLYTLKQEPHMGYPSFYQLYMEEADPTEYAVATKHLWGWQHWEQLSACPWFKRFLDIWRRELEVKLRAEALNRLRATAATNSPSSFQANKYLLDGSWKTGDKPVRGRPSKDEIKRVAVELAEIDKTLQDDYTRIIKN